MLRNYRTRRPGVHLCVSARFLTPAEQIEAVATSRIDVGFRRPVARNILIRSVNHFLVSIASGPDAGGGARRPSAGRPEKYPPQRIGRRTLGVNRTPWVSPDFTIVSSGNCAPGPDSPLNVEHAVARAQAMLGSVAAGLGVNIVPEIVSRLPAPGIVFVPLKERLIYEHAVIWRKESLPRP